METRHTLKLSSVSVPCSSGASSTLLRKLPLPPVGSYVYSTYLACDEGRDLPR